VPYKGKPVRLPDVLERQGIVLLFAVKACYVLHSWKRFCCPWISSGVLENSWITPEQLNWLLCSVIATPVNKVLLQELNQLIGIEMLASDFPTFFGFLDPISREAKTCFAPLRTPMKAVHRICLNKTSLKKFQVIWQPYKPGVLKNHGWYLLALFSSEAFSVVTKLIAFKYLAHTAHAAINFSLFHTILRSPRCEFLMKQPWCLLRNLFVCLQISSVSFRCAFLTFVT